TFQPDFLVMYKDGSLGIFDTKASGYQEDDNKKKAEALQKYIKEENKNGKNLFGGLIIKDKEHFRINQKDEYKTVKECFEDWEYFVL
ncbi:MAG: type restriction enzyme, partial [Campylobacterota bacterium]|nr:type restriction enzyme [Campylobacterota bacterium]